MGAAGQLATSTAAFQPEQQENDTMKTISINAEIAGHLDHAADVIGQVESIALLAEAAAARDELPPESAGATLRAIVTLLGTVDLQAVKQVMREREASGKVIGMFDALKQSLADK